MKLAIAEEDKLVVKSLLKALDPRDQKYIDQICLLNRGSVFFLLLQNILEFCIRSVGTGYKNNKKIE